MADTTTSETALRPVVEAAESVSSRHRDHGSLLCFACSRCEYPICVGADLLTHRIPGGTTDYAFEYDLDFLLDIDDPVPCYSGNEVVQTAIRVSEKVLNQELPPAARVVALEAIVASRQFEVAQRREMEALLHTSSPSQASPPSPPTVAAATTTTPGADTGHEHDQRLAASVEAPTTRVTATGELVEEAEAEAGSGAEEGNAVREPVPQQQQQQQPQPQPEPVAATHASRAQLYQRLNMPIRHLGATSESRVDLVCARTHLLSTGLRLSLRDRSGDNPQPFTASAAAVAAASAADARSQHTHQEAQRGMLSPSAAQSAVISAATVASRTTASTDSNTNNGPDAAPSPAVGPHADTTLDQVPLAIREAVMKDAPPTNWGDAPGNLSVEEAYMRVTRTTHTAQAPWFSEYTCERRVECPDCHLPLGFLFVQAGPSGSSEEDEEEEEGEEANEKNEEGEGGEKGGRHHHGNGHEAEKADEEGEAVHAAGPASKKTRLETPTAADVPSAAHALKDFVALELKRIKQREWTLTDFQERYEKSQHLETFRALFPEAEELQSLYSRLTALRTQAELYSNLLRKHREQNDVQTALLQSQKQRMQTYEEKVSTVQQIMDAQRRQVDMQNTQLQRQQELLSSHRQQLSNQQQQIEVEQLLITEQTKTIATQREQIRLMRAQLQTRRLQDQINEKKLELAERMQQAYGSSGGSGPAAGPTTPPPQPTVAGDAEADGVGEESTTRASPPSLPSTHGQPPAHLRGIRDQGTDSGAAPTTTTTATATASLLSRRWPPLDEVLNVPDEKKGEDEASEPHS